MLCKEELIWHTEICKLAAAICVEKGTEKWDTLDIYISCGAVLQICFLRACRTWPPRRQSRVARLWARVWQRETADSTVAPGELSTY